MGRHFNVHYRSLLLASVLFEAGYAEVNCQNGIDYNNRCNPYKVEFIAADKAKLTHKVKLEKRASSKKHKWFSRTYLNKLLERYSSNYDGRSGLQALIDRSQYGKAKLEKAEVGSIPKKEPQEKKEIVSTKQENGASKISKASKRSRETESVATTEIKSEANKTLANSTLMKEVDQKELLSRDVTTPSLNIQTDKSTRVKQSEQVKESSTVVTKQKSEASQKRKEVSPNVTKVVKRVQKPKLANYRVKKGDTLSTIAVALGMPLKELKSLNKIDKKFTIKVGQTLKVPLRLAKNLKKLEEERVKREKRIALKKEKEKKLKAQLKKGFYIVKKGDSLSKIAKITNLSITQLREYNRIARSKKIKVGQKLLLKEQRVARKGSRSLNYLKNIKFKHAPQLKFKRKIRVVATAYTSHRNQTDRTPFLAAWNNRIRPGMKIIAVSVDLIRRYGLTNGVKVKITGLPGYYVVRDKMNKRLRNHIDIYMGINKRKALRWGRRRVALYW